MSYLFPLTDECSTDVRLSGQKAANLAALRRLGFPVPAGLVVSTELCRDVMSALDTPAGIAPPSLQLPKRFDEELHRQLAAVPTGQRFAVRSSSPEEDSSAASYAGQFETYLNCSGFEEIREAVVKCLLSLWSPRALAYRQFHKIIEIGTIAVLIQEMADCDVSGVAFSIHPVSGDLTSILVNAHAGLGEAVVDGEKEVQAYVLRKDGLTLDDMQTHGPHSDLLDSASLTEIGAMVAKLEAMAAFPQDVEWGIAEGQLVLLQSRPVTAFPPMWSRERSAERFPYAVTPMNWEVVEDTFHRSLRYSFDLMGLPAFSGRWFGAHDHYVYFNKRAREVYLKRTAVPFRHLREGPAGIRPMLDELAWLSRPLAHWDRNVDIYLDEVMALTRQSLETSGLAENWAQILRVRTLAFRYFAPNVAISQGHAILMRALTALVTTMMGTDKADTMIADLTLGCKTKTGLFNDELRELADVIAAQPALATRVRRDAATDAVQAIDNYPQAKAAFDRFLSAHYHREVDHFLDPYYPSLGERPELLVENVKICLDLPTLTTAKASSAARRQREAVTTLLTTCPTSNRADLLELVELTRTYISLDDTEHYQTSRLHTPTRRYLRAMGRELTEAGVIEEELDICFGSYEAVDRAVATDMWDEVADIVRVQKASFLAARGSSPPWQLGQVAAETPDAGSLVGIACSGGVAEGPVRIVRSSADFTKVNRGDILVAPATPPAWTALFYTVAAVVTEGGGALSHGAVIAREVGIPAVMGLPGVLTAFHDGDRVRVDGGAGRVVLLTSPTRPTSGDSGLTAPTNSAAVGRSSEAG